MTCGELCWTFQTSFSGTALIDIAVVALIFFGVSLLLRGTQAVPLLRGTLIVMVIAGATAVALPLTAFRWLLGNVITAAAVAIPVIFQPELRRVLERVGRAGIVIGNRSRAADTRQHVIEAICTTAARLAERRQGALMVIEQETGLQEYIDSGVILDADISYQLLLTIFWVNTELHDGAAIIRNGRIAAAGCVLPLSSGRNQTERKMGTRHRAGLGISEVSDAICIIVSEETGQIAITNNGRIIRQLTAARLKTILQAFYGDPTPKARLTWRTFTDRIRRRFGVKPV